MKGFISISILVVMFITMLNGCVNTNTTAYSAAGQDISDDTSVNENTINLSMNNGSAFPIPQELETIPQEYRSTAKQQGTLIELYYDTYESKTYGQKIQTLQKRAIIYLPYGYDENQKYNVFYLMHGGWGNETTTLGTPNARQL
jgi:predicted small secreted protein